MKVSESKVRLCTVYSIVLSPFLLSSRHCRTTVKSRTCGRGHEATLHSYHNEQGGLMLLDACVLDACCCILFLGVRIISPLLSCVRERQFPAPPQPPCCS